jgi:hypothetical protein
MTSEIGQRMGLRIPLGNWNILANESYFLIDSISCLFPGYL